MYDEDISKICAYISQREESKSLKTNAYQRFALDEILERVMHESEKTPYYVSGIETLSTIDIIKGVVTEFGYYSLVAPTDEASIGFFIAQEEAKKVLKQFEEGSLVDE